MIKKISTTQLIWLGMAIVLCVVIGIFIYRPDFYDPLLTLIICIVVMVCGSILLEIFWPRENLESWIYESLQTKWKFREHRETVFRYSEKFSFLLMLLPIIYIILIPVAFLLLLFWVISKGDIAKFSEMVNNFMSVILVFIFIAQTWIFYHQYRYMTQSPLEKPLIWAFSKSNDDGASSISIKNGGTTPVFNISYQISEVPPPTNIWEFKKIALKERSKHFLPILDSGSEKKVFETSTGEFIKMRLTMTLRAKSLGGYSTRLFFYKAKDKDDFRLANVKYMR
jgi:hypothetical protein